MFVYERNRVHIPYIERDRGSREAGWFGIVTPTLKKGAKRVAEALRELKTSLYDQNGRLRDDVSGWVFSSFPMKASDIEWWIEYVDNDWWRLPNRGRYDFDVAWAAAQACELCKLYDIFRPPQLSLGRSPNNLFVKLTGIICGRRLKGCPRPCQEAIKVLLAMSDPNKSAEEARAEWSAMVESGRRHARPEQPTK
jgi:hypothetical protein